MTLSQRDVDHALAYAASVVRDVGEVGGHGERIAGVIGAQMESGLAAFAYGVLEGNYGPVTVFGVEGDLGASILLHAFGLFGGMGRSAGHGHNVAQGLLDGYLQRVGIGLGAKMAKARPNPNQPNPGAAVSGRGSSQYVSGRATPLTVADVANLVEMHSR